jgi:hypothetical protein
VKPVRLGALVAAALIAVTPIATTAPSMAATSPLQFGKWVADIPGKDLPRTNAMVNKETIVVRNTGKKAIAMAGYTLKDKQNHTFVFPKGFTLKAGKSVTVHVGKGTNSATHLYWKQGNYVWNNTGDTATLRNGKGTKLDTCTYKPVKTGTKTC